MTQEADGIARAFRDGKKCSRTRTETDGNEVYLHGSRIAWRDRTNGTVYMTLAGWDTVIARDRLNAICSAFGRSSWRFRRAKIGQAFNDHPIGNRDVVTLG
jgi:hypothetical protein